MNFLPTQVMLRRAVAKLALCAGYSITVNLRNSSNLALAPVPQASPRRTGTNKELSGNNPQSSFESLSGLYVSLPMQCPD